MTELKKDAAHYLVGSSLTTQYLELSHHAFERVLDVGDGVLRVTLTLAVQPMVAALQFLAIELRELGHTKQGVHVGSGMSERQLPL